MKTDKVNGSRIVCYDAGERFLDRFTVLYLDYPSEMTVGFMGVFMSEDPFHPQGFGIHGEAMRCRGLGKRIRFEDLPLKCRMLVQKDLE